MIQKSTQETRTDLGNDEAAMPSRDMVGAIV